MIAFDVTTATGRTLRTPRTQELTQAELPLAPLVKPILVAGMTREEMFESFVAVNPHFYPWIRERARELVDAGEKRISVRMLLELARHSLIINRTYEAYKINNDIQGPLARRLAKEAFMPEGCIELRERQK